MKDLKDYRERELPLFVTANVLLFLIAHDFIKIDMNDLPGSLEVIPQVFISAVLSVIAFGFILTVECLFTSKFKERLVYLFGFFGCLLLPGCTIFSAIKNKDNDNRFSYDKAAERYKDIYEKLPTEPGARQRYENERWYEIYAKHRDVQIIRSSQRDSLLCRDIYISVLVMIGIYAVTCLSKLVSFNYQYCIFLVLMTVTTNVGANRKAARFAYNVIAYDITESPKKEE